MMRRWRVLARFGSLALAATLIAATALYFIFGEVRALQSAHGIARFIPANAQAYVVLPRMDHFLRSAHHHARANISKVKSDVLAGAIEQSPSIVRQTVEGLQSIYSVSQGDRTFRVPATCANVAGGGSEFGLSGSTGAALFIERKAAPSFEPQLSLAIGPIARHEFGRFLASSASAGRYVLKFTAENGSGGARIDRLAASGFRICALRDGNPHILKSGSDLAVDGRDGQAFAAVEFLPERETPTFDITCQSLDTSKRCNCELLAREGGSWVSKGACRSSGIDVNDELEGFRAVTNFVTGDKRADDAARDALGLISLRLPLVGEISLRSDYAARWDAETSTLLLTPDASQSPTKRSPSTSILRSDEFIRLSKIASRIDAPFFGAVRPDLTSGAGFNRIISLPLQFAGRITESEIEISLLANFEPLDARVLQDISREDPFGGRGQAGIFPRSEQANLSIQDEKIGQLVRFADQYVLDRIVEHKTSIDLDTVASARGFFIRYLLERIGFHGEPGKRASAAYLAQTQQVMLFEETEISWIPRSAVAIRFEQSQSPTDFVCQELQRIASSIERKILYNAARQAKRDVPPVEDDDEDGSRYEQALSTRLATLLGKAKWDTLSEKYDFDPVTLEATEENAGAFGSDQACDRAKRRLTINGTERDVYHLMPSNDDVMRQYYYRIPELRQVADQRKREVQQKIVARAKDRTTTRADIAARERVMKMTARYRATPAGPITPPINAEIQQLNTQLVDAGLERLPASARTISDLLSLFEANELNNAETLASSKRTLESIQAELSALVKERDTTAQSMTTFIERMNNEGQTLIATVNHASRTLFVANGIDSLAQAMVIASKTDRDKDAGAGERVRLSSSADTAARWYVETRPRGSANWVEAQKSGRVLPWSRSEIGVTSKQNSVTVRFSLHNR